jgi:hypothetical protein
VAERRNLIRQALTNRRIVITPAVWSPGRRKFDPNRIIVEEDRHAEEFHASSRTLNVTGAVGQVPYGG